MTHLTEKGSRKEVGKELMIDWDYVRLFYGCLCVCIHIRHCYLGSFMVIYYWLRIKSALRVLLFYYYHFGYILFVKCMNESSDSFLWPIRANTLTDQKKKERKKTKHTTANEKT